MTELTRVKSQREGPERVWAFEEGGDKKYIFLVLLDFYWIFINKVLEIFWEGRVL